jgi:hypothetical protein
MSVFDRLPLTAEQRRDLDEMIQHNRKIAGFKMLLDVLHVPLRDAEELYIDRYFELRDTSPGDFTESPEAYWGGTPPVPPSDTTTPPN